MFHSARHNDKFTFVDEGFAVPEFHAQSALDDQEKLVFVFMMMPDEFALELDGFDVAVVDFADDARVPAIGKKGEFFSQIDRLHDAS